MPCLAPWLLRFQGPGITQSSQLHKQRSFHNLFSSARPPLHEKNKNKTQNFSKTAVSRWLVRGSRRYFFRNQGTLDLLFFPLCHILPTGHTHTRTHGHTHTHFPRVNFANCTRLGHSLHQITFTRNDCDFPSRPQPYLSSAPYRTFLEVWSWGMYFSSLRV